MSFFGGGTDYPGWVREYGGAVLGTTIDKFCYISCRRLPPFFKHLSRIVWSQIETVSDNRDIQHPAVREALSYLRIREGVEVHHDGDLPARSGLGSSSAFTVGILHALHGLAGKRPGKLTLAREAIHLEQVMIGENVGSQDQILTAFGGLNRVDFQTDGSFEVTPVRVAPQRLDELESRLMLFYTGISRTASDVAAKQVSAISEKTRELEMMRAMVDEASSLLFSDCDLDCVGRLLHESWVLKRGLTSAISSGPIDAAYEAARAAGAVGGKLLGAGGGGFLLVYSAEGHQRKITEALNGMLMVPLRFETQGTQLIFDEGLGQVDPKTMGVAC